MNTFDSIGFNFDMSCHTYTLRNYKSALIFRSGTVKFKNRCVRLIQVRPKKRRKPYLRYLWLDLNKTKTVIN
jgi:hypothetical protein